MPQLRGLEAAANDEEFLKRWAAVKLQAKKRAAVYLKERTGVTVNPDVMFDVQVPPPRSHPCSTVAFMHRHKRCCVLPPSGVHHSGGGGAKRNGVRLLCLLRCMWRALARWSAAAIIVAAGAGEADP